MSRNKAVTALFAIPTMAALIAACSTEPARSRAAPPAMPPASVTPAVAAQAESDEDIVARSEAEREGWSGVWRAQYDPQLVAVGKQIAERECSSCHAVDRTSKSPVAGAPPLRQILGLVEDEEALEIRFIDGMRVGDDPMPVFDFNIIAADALFAYLETIAAPNAE